MWVGAVNKRPPQTDEEQSDTSAALTHRIPASLLQR
jgi:hypothetical protein